MNKKQDINQLIESYNMAIKGISKTATPGKGGKIYTESDRVRERLTLLEVQQKAAEAEIAILKRSNEMLTFHVQKLTKVVKAGPGGGGLAQESERARLLKYVTPASNRRANFLSSAELFRLIGEKLGAASITALARVMARNGFQRAQGWVEISTKPEGQPPVKLMDKPVNETIKVRGFYCKIYKSTKPV